MASQIENFHFVLVPFMSQSHIIPLTDFAKLLALRGLTVTIITTPLNAIPLKAMVDRATKANLKIQLVPLRFPCKEAGLPEGCENADSLTSPDLEKTFHIATAMLKEPLEKRMRELEPRPSCIVSTIALPWTTDVAQKLDIPRYVFHTISCFTHVCCDKISRSKVLERVCSDSELFFVPNMPHRIEFTKAQLPEVMTKSSDAPKGLVEQIKDAERSSQGVLVNSFEELEQSYAEEYKKMAKKIWCIGPVSLCNKETLDQFDRGNNSSINEHHCMTWLDSMKPSSVIYVCFGSLCNIPPLQLIEIGLGLEASNRPFIWIIKARDNFAEVEKWLEEERFEEKVKGRGLIIRGWAPQVLILSHPSVGGFLTHCGWNSTLEGVCAGVPMITWPMFAEQFFNQKFIVNVLRIGLRIGVEVEMKAGEEERLSVLVKRDEVKKVIDKLMDEGEAADERRKRARELGEMANWATEGGGSSYLNITSLIQDVMQFKSIKTDELKNGVVHKY